MEWVCNMENVLSLSHSPGALAWNGEQLSSGSRDRVILQRDVRTPPSAERRLQGHRQEVCGLKWSPDHQHLASGGNDNKVSRTTSGSYSHHWLLFSREKLSETAGRYYMIFSNNTTQMLVFKQFQTISQHCESTPPLPFAFSSSRLVATFTILNGIRNSTSKHFNICDSEHTLPYPQLLVWNSSSLLPMQQYSDHLAAVKAIAWSPHQHGLLVSGGGTADRCLRFWNTLTGQPLQSTDTGSQVCNLAWSKHANELVRHYLLNTCSRSISFPAYPVLSYFLSSQSRIM